MVWLQYPRRLGVGEGGLAMWEKHDIAKLLFLLSEANRELGKIREELHEIKHEIDQGGQPESPDYRGDEDLPF